MKKQTRLEKNYGEGIDVDCPKCHKKAGYYCVTKNNKVALEPHAARREAVQINTNIKEETDKHKELYFDLAAEKHKVDEELRMLKMRLRHRERVINRMLPYLREHLTDQFILWELIMGEEVNDGMDR